MRLDHPEAYPQRRCGTLSSSLEKVRCRTGWVDGVLPLLRTSALHPKESKDKTLGSHSSPRAHSHPGPRRASLPLASFSPAHVLPRPETPPPPTDGELLFVPQASMSRSPTSAGGLP